MTVIHEQATALQASALATLSPRERQVFDLIAVGVPNRETARRLGLSPRTIETHRARGLLKLRLKNNAEVVRLYTYIEMGREVA